MARKTTVTRGPWSFGTISGSGIKGKEIQPFRLREGKLFRDGKYRIQRGQLYGVTVDLGSFDANNAEIDRLGLEYGYIQHYSRNVCRFVMSRAARRRGYTTDDIWYNRKAKQYAKKH